MTLFKNMAENNRVLPVDELCATTTDSGITSESSQEKQTEDGNVQNNQVFNSSEIQTDNISGDAENSKLSSISNSKNTTEESLKPLDELTPCNDGTSQPNPQEIKSQDQNTNFNLAPNVESSELGKSNENKPYAEEFVEANTVSTGGNEESQSSAEEQTSDVQNCYCGKERNLNIVELQCGSCFKWFHETCISISLGKCVPFMTYYTFFCKACNPSGSETFSKKQPNFSQMCATTLANLMQQCAAEGHPRTMFSKDKEVIPYIEANWEYLTPMQRRIKQTWHTTVYKAVLKDNDIFLCEEKGADNYSSSEYPHFGLVMQDLYKIGPNYETMLRCIPSKQNLDSLSSQNVTGFPSGKGRSAKRRFLGDSQVSGPGKKVKSDLVMPKLPPNGYPLEHPFNKDGYRYILAEPDPHAPFRQEFDESQDWAGKPIPGWLYRKLTPSNVLIAMHDRAPQLKISEDRLTVTGEKGYCMVRATHGVNRGTWYFECTIEEMSDGSATRLGWSQALGNLQAPLGYDKFSYSWRSRKGTKFHESRGYHYSDGYSQGDTLGFLIHLPPTTELIPLPPIFKDKPLVKFKSYLYYEEKDEIQQEIKALTPLPRSKIVFYKNGKCLGSAWENIYSGTYFPALSLYKSCTVSLNFGPNFKHPPEENWKGVYEAAHEAIIEQTMTDLLYFTENKGKLRLDNFMN